MTPDKFIAKWRAADLTERASAQSHFLDLCALLHVKPPYEDDATDTDYSFEKGVAKVGGGGGWADVWKRDCFGWEYKRKGRSLDDALIQLQRYALALENPPLLIVSDIERIHIHTNWTSTVSRKYEFGLTDLRDADKREQLASAFSVQSVERLKPGKSRQKLTEEAATKFAELAQALRDRKYNPRQVAHFIQRLIFCMFAEDVKLLPNNLFQRTLEAVRDASGDWETLSADLFRAMKSGGRIGLEKVSYFNGGLFEDDCTLPLKPAEVKLLLEIAAKYWGDIDPTIFGTLFERGLDPDKRSQFGAHYTDTDKIMRIVEPVVIRPWRSDWQTTRDKIASEMERARGQDALKTKAGKGQATAAINRAKDLYLDYLNRLRAFRVLDPACGSGNFLYLSLHALMDLEHRAGIEAEQLGLQKELPGVGPENVKGIEINPFAAELARVTIWIGWLQWMRRNGMTGLPEPILSVLNQIENRDALLGLDQDEASWPKADVIVGNPPFLGDRKMTPSLGEKYVKALRKTYRDRVPGGADLVCFWFEKAATQIARGAASRAGLVATNSIRFGLNRKVLDDIADTATIYDAWADEPWVVEGADVRVSLACFAPRDSAPPPCLNGRPVRIIRADLTASEVDLTKAVKLAENSKTAFQGVISYGPYEIAGEIARPFLRAPKNPGGARNHSVVRPWANGEDIIGRPQDIWIIFFGDETTAKDAAAFELPFEYLKQHAKPYRQARKGDDKKLKDEWWKLWRSRSDFFNALGNKRRYIATVRHAKHRTFRWLHASVVPDSALVAIAREDDLFFGLVHSRFHEAWALRLASAVGVGNDPRYSHTATFRTFPFPTGMTPDVPVEDAMKLRTAQRIAHAAAELDRQREIWLNPPEYVSKVREIVSGLPERVVPLNEKTAEVLRSRTLTDLYNQSPTWLANLHDVLDRAVAAAYGWPADISTDDALEMLFALNKARDTPHSDEDMDG